MASIRTCSKCLNKYDKSTMTEYETDGKFYLCSLCVKDIYGKQEG